MNGKWHENSLYQLVLQSLPIAIWNKSDELTIHPSSKRRELKGVSKDEKFESLPNTTFRNLKKCRLFDLRTFKCYIAIYFWTSRNEQFFFHIVFFFFFFHIHCLYMAIIISHINWNWRICNACNTVMYKIYQSEKCIMKRDQMDCIPKIIITLSL